jgi:hypothetical protein
MKINLAPLTVYSTVDEVIRLEFLNQISNSLCISEELTLETTLLDFLDTLKVIVQRADNTADIEYFQGYSHNKYLIQTNKHGNPELLVQISWHSDGHDIAVLAKTAFHVTLTGVPTTTRNILKSLRDRYPERLSRIRWWFMAGDTLQCHDVVLEKPTPIKPEYYPFMEDPTKYMAGYLAHSAALLFLSGPPGTGKTTFLRNFLYNNRLRAVVTYEDTLFKSDQMFVDFVTSSNQDIMIIEDADLMLGSRAHAGNKMISRFLNTSDGIIKLSNKKIIFTTNLSSFNHVDEALIRPGRSYDAVMFRALTPDEATVAARAAELPNWSRPETDVTLAEIFNPPNQNSFGRRTIGFAKS